MKNSQLSNILENTFSPGLLALIKSPDTTDIENIDRELPELLAAGLFAIEKKHLIWVVGENESLREKKERLKLWLQFLGINDYSIQFYLKPFEDPYINNDSDYSAIGYKAKLVSQLQDNKRVILLTTTSSLCIKIEKPELLKDFYLKLTPGRDIRRADLTGKLTAMGYRSRDIVEERGDYARRGSIVDVFPIDNNRPVRIEIEADRVVSIRLFNPGTQKSIGKITHMLLPVARFFPSLEKDLHGTVTPGSGRAFCRGSPRSKPAKGDLQESGNRRT